MVAISQGRQRSARGVSASRGTSLTRGGGEKRQTEKKQRRLDGCSDKTLSFRLLWFSLFLSLSRSFRPLFSAR